MLIAGCQGAEEPQDEPLSSSTLTAIGQVQQALAAGRLDESLQLIEVAMPNHEGTAEVHFVHGRVLFELGRYDEAETAYQKAAAIASELEGLWHNMGNVSFQRKRYREALGRYSREADLFPAANPWHGLGGTYDALGLADSARFAYEQALYQDDSYAPAMISLAEWFETAGQFDAALEYARRALEIAPNHPDYLYRVGSLEYRAGEFAQAAKTLELVIEKRPWNYSALFASGQALQRLGMISEARAMLERAERTRVEQVEVELLGRDAISNPTNFQVQIDYADALRRTNRLEDAARVYIGALSLRPNNIDLQNNVATILLQLGQTDEAVIRYRKVLEADSTYANAWINLAIHYTRSSQVALARDAWAKAQQYAPDHPAVKAATRSR